MKKPLGVCKIKPVKPCDKSNQCLRWPPTYIGHFPLQGGCNNRSFPSTQCQTSSRKTGRKEKKILLIMGAAWRCHPALTAQAEAAPALSRAVAGDYTPVWEAEGWQQWLLPCTGWHWMALEIRRESTRAFCSPPCVVSRKPLSVRNKGSDHSSVQVCEPIVHPRGNKNRT